MGATRSVGRYGEQVAARHLGESGFRILERNWRCRWGEIDIVAVDGDCLVVCEVKTRRSGVAGTALESITTHKLARLRRLAAAWLADQGESWPSVRLDLVAVTPAVRGRAQVEHVRGIG